MGAEIPCPDGSGGQRTSGTPAPLELWRALDWRFLLPDQPLRQVSFLGSAPRDEVRLLTELGVQVSSAPSVASGDPDVVIAAESTDVRLHAADLNRLPPGVWLLVRTGKGGLGGIVHRSTGSVRRERRRIEALGFTVHGTHWHAPDRARPSYVVNTSDPLAVDMMLQRHHGIRFGRAKSLVARVAARLGLVQVMARDLTVVARRSATGRPERSPAELGAPLPSAVESVLPGGSPPVPRLLITPWFEASRHVICLYYDRRTRAMTAVAKVPRRPRDTGGITHEATVLAELTNRTDRLAGRVPQILAVSTGARPFLLETAVAGAAAGPEVVRASPDALLESTLSFLDALPTTGDSRWDPSWFTRLVEQPLNDVVASVGLDVVPSLVAHTLELLEPLRTAVLPLVLEHGDLGHPNLVLRKNGELGAVDWERAEIHGLPGHDLVFLLQYVAESMRATFELPGQLAAFDAAFTGPGAWARPWLRRYSTTLGLDEDLLPPLVLATWVRSSAGLVSRARPQLAPGDEDKDGKRSAAARRYLADVFGPDRDFALWRHAAARFHHILQ